MNALRFFFIAYLFASVIFAFSALYVPFSPGPEIAGLFADSDGKYEVLPAAGLILVILLLPMGIILFFVGKLVSKRSDRKQQLLDQSSLTIKRHKTLYNAVSGITIYLNDKKYGTIMIGKAIQVGLPIGENTIYAEADGQKTETLRFDMLDDLKPEVVVGYELVDGKQELFIRKT